MHISRQVDIRVTWLIAHGYLWHDSGEDCREHLPCQEHLLVAATIHCNTWVLTATHCNTLQHSAAPCNARANRALSRTPSSSSCNTLQHTATHWSTLHRPATHAQTEHSREHLLVAAPMQISEQGGMTYCYVWHDSFYSILTHSDTLFYFGHFILFWYSVLTPYLCVKRKVDLHSILFWHSVLFWALYSIFILRCDTLFVHQQEGRPTFHSILTDILTFCSILSTLFYFDTLFWHPICALAGR